MQTRSEINTFRTLKLVLLIVLFTAALIIQSVPRVFAATALLNRSDKMSDSAVGATSTHVLSFTFTNFTDVVGSVKLEFCSNNPIPESACVPPNGFDASGASLINQTGETGFTIHANSNANNIILTRVPAPITTADVEYEFDTIINPSDVGTFYIRLRTFSSDNATGTPLEVGGIALSINRQFNVSAEVPPFLRFCASVTIVGFDCSTANSFLIDLGEFSTSQTKFAQAEMMAVTNAASGLSISISGTTLTSGNNTISPLTSQAPSSTGVSQFGINLRANSSPPIGSNPIGPGIATPTAAYNNPNLYRFQPGDVVASSTGPNDYRKFTISYIANIDAAQPPGVYATTISFICLANF